MFYCSLALYWRCVKESKHHPSLFCWSSCMFDQFNSFTHSGSNASLILIQTRRSFYVSIIQTGRRVKPKWFCNPSWAMNIQQVKIFKVSGRSYSASVYKYSSEIIWNIFLMAYQEVWIPVVNPQRSSQFKGIILWAIQFSVIVSW